MPIVVCVPFLKPHKQFLPHFVEWYAANKAEHDLRLHWQMFRSLDRVQEGAVNLAREVNASHILFTEDDQWGFPVDGLDVLLEADRDVIGFQTYKRTYPFTPFNFRKIDPDISLITDQGNLRPFYQGDGPLIQSCDLITWAFTLVRTDVFDRLKSNPFRDSLRQVPTDSAFCQACLDVDMQPQVHFGAIIHHGDYAPADIPYQRWLHDIQSQGPHATKRFPEAAPHFGLEPNGRHADLAHQ